MSRAFVKEDDGSRPEHLPDHPVSAAPNLVTARGLRLIADRVEQLNAALAASPEEPQLSRLRRDLRYWNTRHATARLTEPDQSRDAVQFGSRVTYMNEEGSAHTLRLTGEDEADPATGRIAYTAPVARALMGLAPGETATVRLHGAEVEIEVTSLDHTPEPST